MENIIITEHVETDKDKHIKYAASGCPQRFIALDEKQKETAQKYQFTSNVDKLLRMLSGTQICLFAGETVTELYESTFFKRSEAAPTILVTGNISVGHAETNAVPEYVGTYEDYLLGRIIYRPPQGKMFLRLLPVELYSRIFYPFTYRAWFDLSAPESVIEIIKKPEIIIPMGAELEKIGKIFGISTAAAGLIINFSREFFVKALVGEMDENYLGLKNTIELEKKKEKDLREQLTVEAVKMWIIEKFGLSGPPNRVFNKTEQNILGKGKTQIYNKFLPACIHMQKPDDIRELKVDGDYLVCPHGNKIRCRHTVNNKVADISKFIEEFGEKRDNMTICKICGERLLANPSIGYSVFGPKSNVTVSDDIRKFIFRRCMVASSYIKFNDQVSEEYVMKLAGNVVNAIVGIVTNEMNKIDKLRGVSSYVILAMKEIVCQIYAMCAYFLLAEKNKDAFVIKGKNSVEGISKILHNVLADKINAVKEMREIHLENLITMVVEELGGRSIKAPREFTVYDDRDTEIFRFLERFSPSMEKYPNIELNNGAPDFTAAMLENVKFLGIVMTSFNGIMTENWIPAFKSLLEKWKNLKAAEYIKFSKSPWRKYLWTPDLEPAIYRQMDFKYMGLCQGSKGGMHVHKFQSGMVDGKVRTFSSIELNEKIDTLVCSKCGQESEYKNLLDESITKIESESKQQYFSIFCPVNFSHEFNGGKCKFCGYIIGAENLEFYKKYKLPTKIVKLKEFKLTEPELYVKGKEVLEEKIKFFGKTPKAEYTNFWQNLGRWEDVTYKDFSEGKAGNEILGTKKIRSSFVWLISVLARIKNIKNKPDPLLQNLTGNVDEPLKMSISFIESKEILEWVNYKNAFIKVFNILPDSVAEYVIKNLIKMAKKYAKSDESTYADALASGYKTNDFQDNTDLEDGQTGKLESIYEGMDYDGKNEK